MSLLVLGLALSAAPVRLVHSVAGTPVGLVELDVRDGLARYTARHFFRGEQRSFERSWKVDAAGRDDDGLVAELQAFTMRRAGCQDVREERTGRRERLCLSERGTGTLDGVEVKTQFDATGLLAIEVLHDGTAVSRFERPRGKLAFGDPFGAGFPVAGEGAGVALVPPAKTRVEMVDGVREPVAATNCLEAARAWVERSGGSVQLGLVLEEGRAWPHAWVRVGGRQLDPTVGAEEARARTYLGFDDDAGALYLDLAAGARRVARSRR